MINSPLFLNMFLDAHFENIFFLRKSGKCSQSSHKMVDFGGGGEGLRRNSYGGKKNLAQMAKCPKNVSQIRL